MLGGSREGKVKAKTTCRRNGEVSQHFNDDCILLATSSHRTELTKGWPGNKFLVFHKTHPPCDVSCQYSNVY